MTDMILSLLAQLTVEFRKRPRLRATLALVSPIIGIVLLLLKVSVTAYDNRNSPMTQLAETVLPPIVVLSFALFFMTLLSYTPFEFHPAARSTDSELEALRRERAELRARLDSEGSHKQQGPADVLDTIRLSLNQLTEYYTINKGQAKSSFRASMGAMVVGLLTILVGIWIFYSNPGGDVKVAVIAGIAGILAEFIAGAYFYLYNRSLTQLNYFYDKLTSVQDTMLAIKLCETLPEPRATATREKLIEVLMTPGRIAAPQAPSSPSLAKQSLPITAPPSGPAASAAPEQAQ